MEPIPRVEEEASEVITKKIIEETPLIDVCFWLQVREAQEETSFEGPTWYVEEEGEGEPSPRGAVHEV